MRDPSATVDETRLCRMRDVLAHRGPDGAGLWARGPVGLAHRRLAIVDVAAGHQPMSNEDGTIWVVFNGEIYNHADLRPRLEARGHRFRTRCDTEAIVHLYEQEGDGLVEWLHGMFAFAIWDAPRRRLLLARDRLGIKPLYYAELEGELLFGSEIKSLLAGGVTASVNEDAIPEFLATRFVSGEETLYRGVRRLVPGHVATWTAAAGLVCRRYWHVPAPAPVETRGSLPAAADELRDRLRSAVRRHLMSDVPLGVFLSGGIDSSALAVLAARQVAEPLRTFAVGFSDPGANELGYARQVARWIGAEHRDVVVSAEQYFDALPRLIWQEDEPIAFPSSVPLYFVSALAREYVKVVLTGEGADELFLGYNRYRVTAWNARMGRPYWAVAPRRVQHGLRTAVARLPARLRRVPERTFLALEPGARALFFENFAVFPHAHRHALLVARDGRDPYTVPLRCYDEGAGSILDRMSRADLQTYLHELLMKQDQMSMAASIESRVPFLDDAIVDHVAGLPGALKLRGWQTKAVLRAAVRDLLPAPILERRKMGFPTPVSRWLRGRFWPVVDEFVLGPRPRARGWFRAGAVERLAREHRAGAADHGDRLWLLVNFEIWLRIIADGEAPADIMRPVLGRTEPVHARAVDENGRTVATGHRRPLAELSPVVGAGAASLREPRDHGGAG